jgi:FBP C-terminal treble-clef zinc-finger
MFILNDQQELTRAFRPRDQRGLELPGDLSFPKFVRNYLAWVDEAGARTFVVFQNEAGQTLGLAFRRDQDKSGGASQLCGWCHTVSPDVGLITTDKNSKRRVGVLVCRDLSCAAKLDEAADLAGTSSVEPKRRQLERMRRFAREGLGIERVP